MLAGPSGAAVPAGQPLGMALSGLPAMPEKSTTKGSVAPLSNSAPWLDGTVQNSLRLIAVVISFCGAATSVSGGSAYPGVLCFRPAADGRYRKAGDTRRPPLGMALPTPDSTTLPAARLDSISVPFGPSFRLRFHPATTVASPGRPT